MTDKDFTKKLSELNTMLWNCISSAEELLNTDQAKLIKQVEDNDASLETLKKMYNKLAESSVDCDLNASTLSDVSMMCQKLYIDN